MRTTTIEGREVPIYSGKVWRAALFSRYGLPNAWPIDGDDERAPWRWRGALFVDDDRDGKPVALWVPEDKR